MEGAIGCIDGTYIQIPPPRTDPPSYVCRKRFHAVTLQGICDPSLKFIDVYAGFPSSAHDSRVLRNSNIFHEIHNNPRKFFPNDEFIVADKAYPLRSWLMTPYIDRGHLTPQKIEFNTIAALYRQCIERTFALFKGRFRRMKYLHMSRLDLIPALILSSCVLHNLCLELRDDLIEEYIEEGADNRNGFEEIVEERWIIDDVHDDEAGKLKRNRMAMNIR